MAQITQRTALEAYHVGYRHWKRIMYYPCSCIFQDESEYQRGYKDGREHYRKVMGKYPSTGDKRFDKVVSAS